MSETKIILGLPNINDSITNLVVGQFEFVHKGHLKLFSELDDFSFLTFKNNPSKSQYFFNFQQRLNNLKQFNPKYIFVFDIHETNLSAIDFINSYLKKINPLNIVVGNDFHFGKDKLGDVNLLLDYFKVTIVERDKRYSSNEILKLLEQGKLEVALELLAIPIYFEGIVVRNNQLGRKLGYPTANLLIDSSCKMLYGSYVSILVYNNKEYHSLSFFGSSKTLNSSKLFFETHIFNFEQDIYEEKIIVYPKKFIRSNTKFRNQEELIRNIKKDEFYAKKFFAYQND